VAEGLVTRSEHGYPPAHPQEKAFPRMHEERKMSRRLAAMLFCAALALSGCAPMDTPGPQAGATQLAGTGSDGNATSLTLTLNTPESFGEAYAAAFKSALTSAGYPVMRENGQCRVDQTITVAPKDAPEKKRFSPSFGLESLAIKSIIKAGEYLYHMEEISETVDTTLRIQCGERSKGFTRRYTYDKVSQEEINAAIATDQAELTAGALSDLRRAH
jgi:hypothetical protein